MSFIHDLDSAIDLWFGEDIREGDHTTLSTIPPSAEGSAVLLVKQKGILAGMEVARRIFERFDPMLGMKAFLDDGSSVDTGMEAFRVRGSVQSILQCERLVLNVMQRMSGIATAAREYADLVRDTGARILDTRKTTPGFRMLEKEAVRIGGGENHRFGLFDMILIKDNHIDFAGGIGAAIHRAGQYLQEKSLDLKIVVEARSLQDIKEVLDTGGVHRILLDNFSVEGTRQAVALIGDEFETESSGGINSETIRAYAECGVDYISVGALTHQINSLDLSLKAEF